jgi:two-component system, cell cycle sensor histidine kinase and response regulator CckA
MQDEAKSKEQLLTELEHLRGRVAELEREKGEIERARLAVEVESEQRRTLIDQSGDGIVILDQSGKVVETNRAFSKMLGYTLKETERLHVWNWDAQMTREELEDVLRRIDPSGAHFTTRHRRKDGSIYEVEISATAEVWGGRKLILCVCRDISERLRAKEALKESEERYRQIADNIHEVFWVADADLSMLLYVSPGYERVWGLSCESLYADPRSWAESVHPEDRQRVMDALCPRPPEGWCCEYRILRPEGTMRWVLDRGFPVRDASGEIYRLAGTVEDITERKQAEEALRRSRAFLDDTIEQSPVSMWIADETGTLIRTNQALRETFGVSDEEVVGKYNILNDNLVQEQGLLPLVRDVFERGRTVRFTINYDTPRLQGLEMARAKHVILEVIMSAILDARGKVTHAIIQHLDVAEQKRVEAALKDSNRLLDQIIEFLPDATFVIDTGGRVTHWNRATERITGVAKTDMLQKGDYEYAIPFYGTRRPTLIDAALSMASDPAFEPQGYNLVQRDGETILGETFVPQVFERKGAYLSATASILRDGCGEIAGAIESIRDITEHRRTEESLRESGAQLRQIIDLVPHMIFVKDWDGKYLLANRVVAEGYNTTVSALTGKSHALFHPDREQLERMLQDDREVMEMGETKVIQKEAYTDAQGTVHFLETTKVPFRTSSSRMRAVLGVAVDITERKRADEEKAKLQAQLLQAQKMESVGRLAGGVAHDFNNMLGIILGHTEMILDEVDSSQPVFSDLQEIHKAAQRSSDLTRQLLAFARKQTVAPKVLDLNETVEGMLKMLRRLIGEDIDLAWHPGENLWPVMVDPTQIDQILANLCVNARDAIPGVGKIMIETGNVLLDEAHAADHPGSAPGKFVLLAVTDNGCGMDRGTLENVFEPFFTTKEVGKGTGLGLATVYGIVKQNRGLINAYSEPGQGTTFKIYLPMHAVPSDEKAKPDSTKSPRGNGETLLLVEDEAAILAMTKTMLERQGYVVLPSSRPTHAMRLAEEHNGEIHLLLTDVILPEMNGRELARRLLAIYPGIKTLFMSGYTANAIAHQGVLDSGVSFIQKPFSKQQLFAKVRETLGALAWKQA